MGQLQNTLTKHLMGKKDFKMKIVKLVEMKKQKRNVQNAKLFNIVTEIVKNIIGLCIRNIVQKSKKRKKSWKRKTKKKSPKKILTRLLLHKKKNENDLIN